MNKLIKIKENYYVIDDSEIKEGDKSLLILDDFEPIILTHFENVEKDYKGKRITHSTQEGIGIQLNLNDIEELVNEYSIKEMAEKDAYLVWNDETTFENEQRELNGHIIGFIEGFKAHKELSKDKLFTVNDMKLCYMEGWNRGRANTSTEMNNYIQSLLPPTEWNIEFQNGKIILV
mgnify:CR=1 FL=1